MIMTLANWPRLKVTPEPEHAFTSFTNIALANTALRLQKTSTSTLRLYDVLVDATKHQGLIASMTNQERQKQQIGSQAH